MYPTSRSSSSQPVSSTSLTNENDKKGTLVSSDLSFKVAHAADSIMRANVMISRLLFFSVSEMEFGKTRYLQEMMSKGTELNLQISMAQDDLTPRRLHAYSVFDEAEEYLKNAEAITPSGVASYEVWTAARSEIKNGASADQVIAKYGLTHKQDISAMLATEETSRDTQSQNLLLSRDGTK